MYGEYVGKVTQIRTIAWLPEGKILVFANSSAEADYVRENVVPGTYEGWPVEVTYREYDEQALIADTEALREEYKDVPEIENVTWTPEGEIHVQTLSREDAIYVGRRLMQSGVYRGWPVIVGWIITFPAGSTTSIVDPNYDRWEVTRPLVGGILITPYIRYYGGGRPSPPVLPYGGQDAEGVASGTLGMVTYDDKILSCAHVIAMDPQTWNYLPTGTPIYQPDGEENRIGELEAYIDISFSANANNYADAAIASIDGGIEASPGEVFNEGGNYVINGWTTVSNGAVVRKSGMMTSTTTGKVTNASTSVTMYYGNYRARYVDQIEVRLEGGLFSFSGDSGSVVDKGGKFVGLVAAGKFEYDPDLDRVTQIWGYISKAARIINGLGIKLAPPTGGGGRGPPVCPYSDPDQTTPM